MGLFSDLDVGEVVPLPDRRVIVDHGIIDDRRSTEVVDDGGAAHVDPNIPVVVHAAEMILVNQDGMVRISIIPNTDMMRNVPAGDDHRMTASPVAVAVVNLVRRQRHPSHVKTAVNP